VEASGKQETVIDKLPTVRKYMDTSLDCIAPEMDIRDAVDFLLEHRVTGAPVVKDGELVGILSEKDCLRLLTQEEGAHRGTVADYMIRNVVTIPSTMDIYFAAGIFLKNTFRRMPVVDGRRVVGQITRRDILRAIKRNLTR
jgi:CBS domain-containing protein